MEGQMTIKRILAATAILFTLGSTPALAENLLGAAFNASGEAFGHSVNAVGASGEAVFNGVVGVSQVAVGVAGGVVGGRSSFPVPSCRGSVNWEVLSVTVLWPSPTKP